MAPQDYTRRSFQAAAALIAVLICVAFIPPQTICGIPLRRANILSDILSFEDAAAEAAEPALFDEDDFHVDMAQVARRIEAERIVVSVRPYKREQRRCPVCGRACDFYDMANRGAPRLWRAMDLARSACYLEYAPCRVRCPEHGVRTEAVPWARHGARFTRDFEDWVAWLAVRCTASAVSELARVEWHSVGGVCRRVYAELEAARGASRFDGCLLYTSDAADE